MSRQIDFSEIFDHTKAKMKYISKLEAENDVQVGKMY